MEGSLGKRSLDEQELSYPHPNPILSFLPHPTSDNSNLVPCFKPDFMHSCPWRLNGCRENVQYRERCLSSLALPSSGSVAFAMQALVGSHLLHISRTWRMVSTGIGVGGRLLETVESRFEAEERCWSPGRPSRSIPGSSPSLRGRGRSWLAVAGPGPGAAPLVHRCVPSLLAPVIGPSNLTQEQGWSNRER